MNNSLRYIIVRTGTGFSGFPLGFLAQQLRLCCEALLAQAHQAWRSRWGAEANRGSLNYWSIFFEAYSLIDLIVFVCF